MIFLIVFWSSINSKLALMTCPLSCSRGFDRLVLHPSGLKHPISALIISFLMNFSHADVSHASICDQAALLASRETGVPYAILWSVTRIETGRSKNNEIQPWPWAVNFDGQGEWFENLSDAKAYVTDKFNRGKRNFDVGCFQINFKWHGREFRSIDQMFDPVENARYAASFLLRLYKETGDWPVAVGKYHSRTPRYASQYKARFKRILAMHGNQNQPSSNIKSRLPQANSDSTTVTKSNRYPLLKPTGEQRAFGSLVPLNISQTSRFLGISSAFEGS